MSMRPLHITYTATGEEATSPVQPVTGGCSGYAYSLNFSGALTSATLQYTRDEIWPATGTFSAATAQWTSLGAKSADWAGTVDGPVTAFRLVYTGEAGATVTLNLAATE